MKKIFASTLILFASIGVLAQEKTLQKEEFDAVQKTGFTRYGGKSYRQIENIQNYDGISKRNISSKTTTEFSSSGSSRMTYEFNSSTINSKRETIRVDGITYTKLNNEQWKIEKAEAKPMAENRFSTVDEQTEYKFVGNEKWENQTANVYQKTERKKRLDSSNNNETLSTTTTKYWFAEDGRIVKQEANTESRTKNVNPEFKERIFRHLSTRVWEVDPNIKIEIPNVNLIK